MKLLEPERQTLEEFLPGLDKALAQVPLQRLESRDSPALQLFRKFNGPALLVPGEYGGLGASAVQAIGLQRAIGSRSPSLAVATTMHHSTIAAVVELHGSRTQGDAEMERVLLESIAHQHLLVASGFAEGRTGTSDFVPLMKARRGPNGLVVNGSKKPCSITWSMDLLTASVLMPSSSGHLDVGLIVVPAGAAGLERRPFWQSPILAGAESDEIVLRDVEVPDQMVFPLGNPSQVNEVLLKGLIWFQLLISASYLGAASALVERALVSGKGEPVELALLGIEIEGATAALEGIAYATTASNLLNIEDAFVRSLLVRFSVARALERVTQHAAEVLGGMAFVRSFDVGYLLAAARALAFHPPSRLSVASSLTDYLRGSALSDANVALTANG